MEFIKVSNNLNFTIIIENLLNPYTSFYICNKFISRLCGYMLRGIQPFCSLITFQLVKHLYYTLFRSCPQPVVLQGSNNLFHPTRIFHPGELV